VSLFGLLERHLARGAGRPLLVTADGTLSSGDVARESAKLAAWLRAAGTAPAAARSRASQVAEATVLSSRGG
jgi:hypothetical protein